MTWTVEQMLVKQLQATAGVTALVGERIYPGTAPQGTTADYITYELLTRHPFQAHDGSGGLYRARMSFLCHSATYANAKAAVAAVTVVLDGFKGTMQGMAVGSCLQDMEADAGFDDELRMHVVVVDFTVLYQ
jgi:hypothetical protein